MRNGGSAGAVFADREESGRDHGIGQRHCGRHAQSAADTDRLAVHEGDLDRDQAKQVLDREELVDVTAG